MWARSEISEVPDYLSEEWVGYYRLITIRMAGVKRGCIPVLPVVQSPVSKYQFWVC